MSPFTNCVSQLCGLLLNDWTLPKDFLLYGISIRLSRKWGLDREYLPFVDERPQSTLPEIAAELRDFPRFSRTLTSLCRKIEDTTCEPGRYTQGQS